MQLSWVSRASRSSVSVFRGTTKGSNTFNTVVHARKHAEKKATPAITADDEASQVLPADLDKLRQLNKGELQRELDVRGLDRQGDKLELANRLLDNLISQESALQPNNGTSDLAETPSDTITAPARRGRRTSRKATTALDPTSDGHTPAAAAAAPEIPAASPEAADTAAVSTAAADPAAAAPTSRRGRKTSRRVSSVLSEQQEEDSHPKSAAEPELQRPEAEEAAVSTAETSASTASRRARRTSRKTTTADPAPAEASTAPAADVAAVFSTGSSSSKRARRTSRASSVVEPAEAAMTPAAGDAPAPLVRGRRVGRKSSTVEPAEPVAPPATSAQPAAAEEAPVAPTGRGRRTSHKSSVIDSLEPIPIAAPDATAAEPARRPRARSGAKTTSTGPVAEATPAAAVDGSSRSSAAAGTGSSSSRAKLLAQELAKKVMTTPTVAATAAITPVAAAAVAPEAVAAAAAPVIPAAGEDTDSWAYDQFYAGSQAQSDSLIMAGGRGTESSDDNWSATYEEILAQVAAEEAAGLADEAQILDSTTVDSMVAAATAAAAPNLADIAAAGDAIIPGQQLMPSLVEGALIAEKTQPDDALSAFDKLSVEYPAAAAGAAELAVVGVLQHQQPDLSDISAAVIEGGDESPLEEDEAADEVLSAFDHLVVEPPVRQLSSQDPSIDDIAAAMSVVDPADSSLGEDEEPDVALTAFDHMVINAPAAQPAEQHPTMTDIAAAITQEPAAAANEVVLGEDEEADEALTALDHIDFAAPDAAVTDEAASTTVAVPVTAVSSSFVGGNSSSSDADGFAGLFKGWVAAVMKMFEDWQKSLAPK